MHRCVEEEDPADVAKRMLGGKDESSDNNGRGSDKECARIDLESKRADGGEEGQRTNNTPGLSRKLASTIEGHTGSVHTWRVVAGPAFCHFTGTL